MRLPDFIIVGAPRSGTSALYHFLGQHPAVHAAPGKELHFFDQNWDRGLEWYADQFAGASPDQVTGEATPAYLSDPRATERIGSLDRCELLVILREPVARAHSHFHYRVARGLDSGTFEAAIRRELEGHESPRSYLTIGRYVEHLERIETTLPHLGLHVFWHDDLLRHPGDLLDGVAAALGIGGFGPVDTTRRVNTADRFRSLRLRRWSQPRSALVRKTVGRVNRVETTYPALGPETRALLSEYYAGSIDALAERTGRDLSAWKGASSDRGR